MEPAAEPVLDSLFPNFPYGLTQPQWPYAICRGPPRPAAEPAGQPAGQPVLDSLFLIDLKTISPVLASSKSSLPEASWRTSCSHFFAEPKTISPVLASSKSSLLEPPWRTSFFAFFRRAENNLPRIG